MAKIADVINLKTGYADFVELKDAFDKSQENADRMAMYRPTKAHRTAFERLCRGLYQPNDKKFYLLSGSYGTGKSHLCLMYANFLNRSSGDPDIVGFYQNYERLDADTAKNLRNIRKDGQYLVAICDYHSGRRFEDVVLKAIFEACEKKELDIQIQTQFDEAERFIADWESKSSSKDGQHIRNFYQDFAATLENVAPGMTIDQLRENLKDFNSESLITFSRAFKEMMGGLEFQPQAGNLIPIVRNLVRSTAFKERFKGLAILFDEFGFTLEKASYSKDVLQGFMETICKNEPNVVFVGCVHKDFKAYADRFSQDDASVMNARITTVGLFNEGIEEIIGAIVETDKESDIWQKEIFPKTGIFDQLVPICKTLNLFPWIEDINRIRQQVLEDIYGVHPMALACLLRLSSEIGSNARSTFTYFSGKVGGAEGSYADFIEKSDVTIGAGKLNLYTVDQLYTFFKPELSQKNPELRDRQRQLVNGYYASLDTLRKASEQELFNEQSDEHIKILRSILIYQLCQVPTTLEAIQFGQYCLTKSEETQVEKNLKFLTKTGSVFYRQQSKTYELALGVGEDPYDLIERYINDPSLHPDDLVASFLKEAGNEQELEFLEAKQYNLHFSEDKRFKRYFVPAKDIGDKLWQKIINDWENDFNRVKRSFEGAVVYALCENETDIQLAKDAINDIPKSNFALAVPHSAQPFTDTLLRVKACFHFLPPNEAEKISAQTELRMRDILENAEDGFLSNLKRILRTIAGGDEACWYGQYGRIIVDRPQQAHKPADMLCESLFKKRCRIKHPDLNYIHDDRWLTNRNTALKQAVDILVTADKVFIDNGNPDSHGQKRYLEKVLFKGAGALKKIGDDGKIIFFECDCNPQHISDGFPALKELCSQMQQLNAGATFPIGNFINDIKSSPYGVGGPALVLLVAHVVRAFGERLRIYTDTTKTNEFTFESYDDIVQIVNDPATKIVFEVRDISPAKEKLIDGIAKAVHAPALKYRETRSLKSAYESLINWWNNLPTVSKIIDLHKKGSQTRLQKLKDILNSAGRKDRFDLMFDLLPSVYVVDKIGTEMTEKDVELVCINFVLDVQLLKSGYHQVRNSIAESMSELFGPKGDMVQCEKIVTEWYQNLNPNQRNPYKSNNEDAQAFLRRLADSNNNFETKILYLLPTDYGFGPVKDWTTLYVTDYVAKLKQAIFHIDEAKPDVTAPHIESKAYELEKDDTLEVEIPDGTSQIIYTLNGEDPKQSNEYKTATEKINFADFIGDKASLRVSMRAVDADGNVSDPIFIQLINKSKEYDIEIEKDLFGKETGKFRFPENERGLISVISSIMKYAVKKGIIGSTRAQEVIKTIEEALSKKQYR